MLWCVSSVSGPRMQRGIEGTTGFENPI
ncbi:hypothetical protein GGP58_003285, partial [Salinibacter ruber]|nr:hypothetical protein [Salinibacter ruber]